MKLLVAGGAGYVGSRLVPSLLERGYEVTVVDQCWFGQHLPPEAELRCMDVFDLTQENLEPFDQVIFLAGLSNDPMAEFSPRMNFIHNAAAPAYLGYTAKQAGVQRFIYACSCSVYGYTVNELYDETRPAVSNYPYGISKFQGEQSLLQLQDESFSVISLRKGTVCGYSPRMRLDLVVNTMFKDALQKGVITVHNPSIWRPVLSIQDAVNAYVCAVEANPALSGIFNIASGNYTVGEIAEEVKNGLQTELGKTARLNMLAQQDYRNYKVNIDKAVKVLSFKPAHDIGYIVQDLARNLDAFSDFDNPFYYNIEVFRDMSTGMQPL